MREVFLPLARRGTTVPRTVIDQLDEWAWTFEPVPARAGVSAATTATAAARSTTGTLPTPPARPSAYAGGGSTAPNVPTAPRTPTTAGAGAGARDIRPEALSAPSSVTRTPVALPPRRPGPVAGWWAHARTEIGSDLTTHGLAYLGVLLLFVGVFGLVAFSFGDVAEGMRPVTEVVIAVAPFLAAWMLLRRGAEIAGRALELAGGLLLPVMGITSLLDGVPIPPDLTGPPLVVAATVVAATASAGYALWSRRHASSALRFLVAPMAWLAVGLAAMGVGREIPSGGGVASVTSAQSALMTVAMALTLALARWRPNASLAAPALTAARIGAPLLGLLVVLSWIAAGFPFVAVLVAGVAGVVVLALLRFAGSALAEVLWWAATVVALELGTSNAAQPRALVAVIALAGFVALLELSARAAQAAAVSLAAAGAALAATATWAAPWWALGAMVALALWSGVRRLHPWALPGSPALLDVTAGITPIAAVIALGMATAHAPLAVLVAAALVLASLAALGVPAVRDRVRRDPSDHFWMLWWDAGMLATSVAAGVMVTTYWPHVVAAQWMLAAAFVVLAISAAAGPLPRAWRAWPVLGLLTAAWLTVAAIVGWSSAVTTGAMAGAALGLVVVGQLVPQVVGRWCSPASLVVAGHVLALGSVGLVLGLTDAALTGAQLTWSATAFAAGLVATVVSDELGRPLVVDLVGPNERGYLRRALQALTTLSLAVCVVLVADLSGLAPAGSTRIGITLSVVAILYAAATWLRASRSLRTVLAWSAVAASLVALPASDTDSPELVSLVVVALLPLVMAAAVRPRGAVWLAWSALAPAAAIALGLALPAYAALREPAALGVVLLAVGGVLTIGAMALDLRGRGWVTAWMPASTGLRPPALVGAIEVVLGTILAVSPLTSSSPVFGGLTLAAAAVVLVLALLTRVWSATAAAALLTWIGVWQLAADSLQTRPWVGLVATVALLAAAEVANRRSVEHRRWIRADVPLLVVAHVTAITSLVTAYDGAHPALVLLALGLIAATVGIRLHRRRVAPTAYGLLASVLVVSAGASAGGGWFALALAAVSLACSVVALRVSPAPRLLLVGAGMITGFAAWLAFASWLDLGPQATADWTAMLAAAITLVCAALLRWTALDRLVLLARAGIALVALLLVPLAGGLDRIDAPDLLSWWSVAAVVVAAAAAGLAAAATHAALRFGSVALLTLAVVEGLLVASATSGAALLVLALLSLAAAVALVLPWRERWAAWVQPVIALGCATVLLGLGVALLALPDAWLIPAALLVASAYAVALSVVTRALALQVVAAVLACAAWVVWAWLALDGNAQWYTVPIGFTLLVVVGLWRRSARRRGAPVAPAELQVLEGVGVLVLVGSSFVQAFTESLAYAVLAAALGAAVAGWGVLTRVRRRLQLGAGIVLAAVAVLVLVPLAHLLPAWSSATLWIVIACLGLAALLFATLLEQGRAVVRRGLDDLHRLTEGWE